MCMLLTRCLLTGYDLALDESKLSEVGTKTPGSRKMSEHWSEITTTWARLREWRVYGWAEGNLAYDSTT